MRAILREKLPRLFPALLLALGLAFTVLRILDLQVSLFSCGCVCALTLLALEAVSLNRRTVLWGVPGLAVLFLCWLLGGSGTEILSDMLRAFTLQVSGVPGALPLVARETALALSLIVSILCFLVSRKQAGSAGALILVLGAVLLLWLADRPDLIPWLIPAGIAAVVLLLLERHPEISLLQVLPWTAAAVLLAFWVTPRGGLVVPDLKERADAIRQAVMDRLFFTEPRDVFSLSSEGYYPQGISQLGGPASPSDNPVMQVSAPRAAYLRGVLMNEYDGRSWRNTLGGRRYLWDASGMVSQRTLLFDQALPSQGLSSALTEPSEVSVRMLGDGASTLFVPQRIRSLRAGGELVPYFTNSSELFATRNLQPGDTWSVSAPLFLAGDPGLGTLVDAAAATEDPRWDAVLETYTALPAHLEEPVWQMAAEITDGLVSPYEKAFALQNYLTRNYRYTLEAEYQPANIDFVTNFLFGTREGYCTYFASALTVLCRMAGLPARYVEGYLAEPDARGEALVTGHNAHAWTEVYFRGFGWLTFDATPHTGRSSGGDEGASPSVPPDSGETPSPSPEASPDAPPETPSPEPEPEDQPSPSAPPENDPDPAPTPDPGSGEDPEENGDPPAPAGPGLSWLLWLLLLLLAAGAPALRWFLTSPLRREKRLQDETDRFDLWLEDTLLRLSAAGLSRRKGETIMNFTRRLDAEEALPVSLSQLGECASLLHYGRVRAVETDTALAREAALGLKQGLSRKVRLRYALARLRGGGISALRRRLRRR